MTKQEIDGLITERILLFYGAMLKRGQIAEPRVGALNPRVSDCIRSGHTPQDAPLGDHLPPEGEIVHHG